MTTIIHFTKMHGLGNDFVVVDDRSDTLDLNKQQIQKIANRNFGVGCDQVLIIKPPKNNDANFLFKIYNSDGTEAEQCGNGARCVANFLFKLHPSETSLCLQTINSLLVCEKQNDLIRVNMGTPDCRLQDIILPVQEQMIELHALSIGNPHAVTIVEATDHLDVPRLGSTLSNHKEFPQGVNVEFMQLVDEASIKLRVYERGTGETLACGSGACAAAIVARLKYHLKPTINVALKGGNLTIQWDGKDNPIYMTGPTATVFEGQITI